ncbi:MAG: glutathione S-transferase family protein [Myxococcales bacterium]|nr:glutathione S-transferase family protein [Myxococcales bacterium]
MTHVALYCFPGSLYSSIARLGLAEKGVRYETRLVDIGPAMKNYSPEYMRLNPRGVVPTLVCDDQVVTDATRIVAWVDEHLPGPSLTPPQDEAAERMRAWIARADAIPFRELSYASVKGPLRLLSEHVVMPRRLRLLRRHRDRNPALAERYEARIRDVEQWTQTLEDPAAIDRIWAQVHATLDALEAELEHHRYVTGDRYGQADVLWTPALARLRMLGLDEGFGGRPRVAAYLARMKARPSFGEAGVVERLPAGRMLRIVGGFVLPRLAVAGAVVAALVWGLAWGLGRVP